MKKIAQLFSIVALMFIFVISVKAVTISTNSTAGITDPDSRQITNQGLLKVSGVESGDSFSYYKIVDYYFNSTTNNISYEFTGAFQAFLTATSRGLTVADYQALTNGSITNGSTQTNSTLDMLLSAYAGYVKTNNISGTAMSLSTDSGVTYASSTVAVGSYMILPTQTNRVYAVMAGNVSLSGDSSGWSVSNCVITAKVSDPTIVAVVEETNSVTATYDIGENHTYKLTATLPTYPTNATNKTITITSVLESTLDFKGLSTLVIKNGTINLDVDSSTGVITLDDINRIARTTNFRSVNTLEINDNKNGGIIRTAVTNVGTASFNSSTNTLTVSLDPDALDNNTLSIEYDAALNNTAVLGEPGNYTETSLIYSNSPYASGTTTKTAENTTVYTYGIKIYKIDEDNSPLEGAKIKLCSDASCNNVLLNSDTTGNTTGSDGYITWTGLAAGNYYIQEIQAPSGFRADTAVKTISINTNGAYTTFNFVNYEMGGLPDTGGPGIYLYTGLGLAFLGGAIALLVLFGKKRKKDEE